MQMQITVIGEVRCVLATDEMRHYERSHLAMCWQLGDVSNGGSYADCWPRLLRWDEGCCPRLKILPSSHQPAPLCVMPRVSTALAWPCETCHTTNRGHSSLSAGGCCSLMLRAVSSHNTSDQKLCGLAAIYTGSKRLTQNIISWNSSQIVSLMFKFQMDTTTSRKKKLIPTMED